MPDAKEYEELFITFLECKLVGFWEPQTLDPPRNQVDVWATFRAFREPDCKVELVAPDGLRRTFAIRNNSFVSIGNNVVRLSAGAVKDEITIDEDVQTGKKDKPRATLS